MSLVKCPYCNNEIDENEKVCPNCHKELKEKYCDICGEKLPIESLYCPKCGNRIKEESVDKNSTNTKKERIKLNKKQWTIIGVIGLVIVSLVCVMLFSEKHYRCVSDKIYAYGEELNGPSGASKISLDLSSSFINNNTKIKLHYFGKEYTAKYHNGFVFWDKEPKVLDGGTEAYTTITKTGNKVNLTITETYPIDGESYYLELRMKFER